MGQASEPPIAAGVGVLLGADFYQRPTLVIAQGLLGAVLVHESPAGCLCGRIVETEGYLTPGDDACHAYRGETPRNRVMFGPPGHAYVYRSYGMHDMLNVVTEHAGVAAAVLIRAVEPLEGAAVMAERRGLIGGARVATALSPRLLAGGPGRLCQALSIDRSLNGHDLTTTPLYLLAPSTPVEAGTVVQTTRIGITRSVDLPWRFYLRDSPAVSVRDRAAEARNRPI